MTTPEPENLDRIARFARMTGRPPEIVAKWFAEPNDLEVLDVEDLAERLDMTTDTVRHLISTEGLPVSDVGGNQLITAEAFANWLERFEVAE